MARDGDAEGGRRAGRLVVPALVRLERHLDHVSRVRLMASAIGELDDVTIELVPVNAELDGPLPASVELVVDEMFAPAAVDAWLAAGSGDAARPLR